jgi:L-arabinose transport system ATP-binding protein
MPQSTTDAPSANHSVALSLQGLSKSFGAVQALSDVSFDIRSGEVLAIVGENGAGKSTLLRTLEGDHAPDTGGLFVDGELLRLANPRFARERGIRVIHQEPEIVGAVSVAENLFLGELRSIGGSHRVNRRALNARAQRHLDALGFGDDLDATALAEELSTAQRQLVEIARAVKPGLSVLALDEPTSSLTEQEVDRLIGVVEGLRADGVAILYVSHRLREVLHLADRVAVLRDGRLIEVRDANGTTEAHLVSLMVGRPIESVLGDDGPARPIGDVALRVRGLTNEWLHDISLDVRRGEIVGVAGLIGAGRSELAKAIFGAVPIDSGTVELAGVPQKFKGPRDAIEAGIGFAPEDRKTEALLLDLSVQENISISVLRRLCRLRVIRKRAEAALAGDLSKRLRVKTPSLAQPVSSLSGGNQQKVVLARWLAADPKVLILDEPTRGIDVGAKAEIYTLIRQLAAQGLAVLFISSELTEVLGVSDRVLVMREGRITGDLPRTEATEEKVLSLAMLEALADSEDTDPATERHQDPAAAGNAMEESA